MNLYFIKPSVDIRDCLCGSHDADTIRNEMLLNGYIEMSQDEYEIMYAVYKHGLVAIERISRKFRVKP